MNPVDSSLAIELRDPATLVPYEKNAKLHPDEQIERLAATIKRFGWDQPIVVDVKGVIIKGHGRRLAALKLGLPKVPVLVRHDLSDGEADALRISDNAVFSSQFDTRMLQEELQRLMSADDLDFGIDDLGLSSKDHDLLIKQIDIAATEALMSDASAEIERQKDDDQRRVEASDREEVVLHEVFGFKRVTREQSRVIGRMMAAAEDETALTGSGAFIAWLELRAAEGVI